MHTDELLFRFKEHMKVLNRSPATIEAYADHVNHFLKTIQATDMKQVTRSMIADYISNLRTNEGTPYSSNTLCLKVRSVKRFFEFLEQTNIIFINPSETIREPKVQQSLSRRILKPEEMERLLSMPDLNTLQGLRDRAMLELFYATGIRKAEMCSLTIYDADLTGKMLRVNMGKGQKDRVVPMGKHAVRFLREYIKQVRPHYTRKNKTTRHLFVNRQGHPMSKRAVSAMVKKYGRSAGLNTPVTPHLFRHCFASDLIRNGADLMAVQKMLGHAYPGTTQIYIKSLGLDIKNVHQKTHPRERDRIDEKSVKPHMERIRPKHEN